MQLLSGTMALFWTLAEGLILIVLRWGLMSLRGEQSGQKVFVTCAVALFGILPAIVFGGEMLVQRFIPLKGSLLIFYRWGLWALMCTLWVVLEGIIMVYVIQIYKILKSAITLRGQRREARISSTPGIPLLVCSLFGFYLFYEVVLLHTILSCGLDVRAVYQISLFYIRICGVFWILFEWIVAFVGIRTYLLLKGRVERV